MKWIGQHIWDYISRFRNDVYLDSPTAGGSDPDKFLGIDSNGKIIYRTGAEVASDIGAVTSETGDISAVTAGTGLSGGGTSGAVTLNIENSNSNITTLSALTSLGAAGATTDIAAGDLTMYNAVNNGNPTISLGSSATERLEITAQYESGAQGLDVVKFISHTAGSSANDARFAFQVDETSIMQIKDAGLNLDASMNFSIGGTNILADSSGTTTLSNIDALDATTEATVEAAIDTLANLTSIGGLTVNAIGSGRRYGLTIKILPSDFMINDDAAVPLSFKDGSNSGVHVNDTANEAIAFVTIPEGMKATHVDIYGTHNKTVKIYELDVNASENFTSDPVSEGAMNTQIDMTDTDSTATNFLAITVTLTATSQRIWGGLVTIAAQ